MKKVSILLSIVLVVLCCAATTAFAGNFAITEVVSFGGNSFALALIFIFTLIGNLSIFKNNKKSLIVFYLSLLIIAAATTVIMAPLTTLKAIPLIAVILVMMPGGFVAMITAVLTTKVEVKGLPVTVVEETDSVTASTLAGITVVAAALLVAGAIAVVLAGKISVEASMGIIWQHPVVILVIEVASFGTAYLLRRLYFRTSQTS